MVSHRWPHREQCQSAPALSAMFVMVGSTVWHNGHVARPTISGAMVDSDLIGGGNATTGPISDFARLTWGVVDSTLRSGFRQATTLPMYVSRGDRAVPLWTGTWWRGGRQFSFLLAGTCATATERREVCARSDHSVGSVRTLRTVPLCTVCEWSTVYSGFKSFPELSQPAFE